MSSGHQCGVEEAGQHMFSNLPSEAALWETQDDLARSNCGKCYRELKGLVPISAGRRNRAAVVSPQWPVRPTAAISYASMGLLLVRTAFGCRLDAYPVDDPGPSRVLTMEQYPRQ